MKVKIVTPSRLHFGLIDLNGQMGRIDGGLGVALNLPNVIIEAKNGQTNENNFNIIKSVGYSSNEIKDLINTIMKALEIEDGISLKLNSQIPAHVGLGSKTQLSLAIARSLCVIKNIEKTPFELAQLTRRGGTSRIGLTAFEQGGFAVDGGHTFGKGKQKETYLPSSASRAPPAPVIYWDSIPDDWYFIITIPRIKRGASGTEEVNIFQEYCPIPLDDVKTISHIILMKILPAVKNEDIETFGHGIYELQKFGFKKVEIDLQDRIIPELIEFCMKNGAAGSGMSSFGPSTFALIKGLNNAQKFQQKIVNFMKNKCEMDIILANVNNNGAQIEIN